MVNGEVSGNVVARGKAVRRAWRGRPWLHTEDVISREGDGPFVDLVDESSLPLGTGLIDERDGLAVRLISSARTRDPMALLRTRLERADARRRSDLLGADAYRLCHGDADGVPGLFVDRFGEGLVLTPETPAVASLTEPLLAGLLEITGASSAALWRRHDDDRFEGELAFGDERRVRFHHGRLVREVDLLSSPHVASVTAQLENQRFVRRWAKGRVLDVFAGFGGYGLQLADAGAKEVLFVEDSEAHAAGLESDASRNGLASRVRVDRTPPAEALRRFDEGGERFDIAVVHPPRRHEAASQREDAARRVFETHKRVLRLLDEGGLLVTWAASTALDEALFTETLVDAATRCRKRLQVLARMGAGPDHPGLLGMPEDGAPATLVARVLSIA